MEPPSPEIGQASGLLSPAGQPLFAVPSAVHSPATSEGNFTLLPGYVSRPGPSPLKQPAQQLYPTVSQGGFLAPSQVHAKAQDAARPVINGGEDPLWKELSEELKRVRELPIEGPAATAPSGENAADSDRTQKPAGKPRRARRAARVQQQPASEETAQATAEQSLSSLSRLHEAPSKLTPAVRHYQPRLMLQEMSARHL